MLKKIITSKQSSYEIRQLILATNKLGINIDRVNIEDLNNYIYDNKNIISNLNDYLFVGSVEYMHKVFSLLKIKQPINISYPTELQKYLKRNIRISSIHYFFESVLKNKKELFIKPVNTKQFTGFVYNPLKKISECDYFTQENMGEFFKLNPKEEIYLSDIISFEQEWRYYIQDNKIIGCARYDEFDSEDIYPSSNLILSMINDYKNNKPYTIDVGLHNNEYILVECNDAYAIGLYNGAMSSEKYLNYLYERWCFLFQNNANNTNKN